jgi:mannose-6-phosphate isomerase-like protein (cupin superfamily)
MKITNETARHYSWGGNCDGWHFLESDSLSVIREKIPPGGGEVLHYHEKAQQLFFILSGQARFEADGEEFGMREGEGFHVPPGVRHMIRNLGKTDLHFVVISEPKSHGDRINVQP